MSVTQRERHRMLTGRRGAGWRFSPGARTEHQAVGPEARKYESDSWQPAFSAKGQKGAAWKRETAGNTAEQIANSQAAMGIRVEKTYRIQSPWNFESHGSVQTAFFSITAQARTGFGICSRQARGETRATGRLRVRIMSK
jgi:hypothetical protein